MKCVYMRFVVSAHRGVNLVFKLLWTGNDLGFSLGAHTITMH